jgi:hypothetical protein
VAAADAEDKTAAEHDAEDKATEAPQDLGEDARSSLPEDANTSLWEDVNIAPVEIALPVGTGFTLRAYRMVGTLTPTEVEGRDEDDPFAQRVRSTASEEDQAAGEDEDDEFDELSDTLSDTGRHRVELDESDVRDGGAAREGLLEDEEFEEELEEEEEEATEPAAEEEVPVFLSHRGKVLLFRSAESLADFVRSGEPNDLAQVDTWAQLVERIDAADIAPGEDDSYELDLVVENLRGGHDVWDVRLLVSAGEIARDLGYALRLEPLIAALAPGSPLDDLDEALRKTADGGLGGVLGRRKLRKIGAQQATLGWRTIIGKISAAVDWRD